jgi:pimeloyl-ACP methyl ester carboxylesterase
MEYDELGLFEENAAEAGLPWNGTPSVRRAEVGGISALVWGDQPPELVLVHGGAQNAHTWDTTALALGRPLVAVDLPGHGHSAWRDDHDYRPASMAPQVAAAIEALAPNALAVCGMSLGGLTSLALTDQRPELVRKLALVDITPGVNGEKSADIRAFVSGPETFDSFDVLLERTMQFNPTRSESSLRRGILHNAVPNEDGTWRWRYDRLRMESVSDAGQSTAGSDEAIVVFGALWDAVSRLTCPLLLLRGSTSPVVDDDDVAELRRRQPEADVVVVDGAGHSIQGDKPVELAALLDKFLDS